MMTGFKLTYRSVLVLAHSKNRSQEYCAQEKKRTSSSYPNNLDIKFWALPKLWKSPRRRNYSKYFALIHLRAGGREKMTTLFSLFIQQPEFVFVHNLETSVLASAQCWLTAAAWPPWRPPSSSAGGPGPRAPSACHRCPPARSSAGGIRPRRCGSGARPRTAG